MLIVYDPLYGDHLRGAGQIESPDRVEVVASRLRDEGHFGAPLAARDVTDLELYRVHSHDYVELVKRECAQRTGGASALSTGDVVVDQASLAVARRAAGGAVVAIETAATTRKPVFALVRPPGHHAERSRGMGFCLFNNAAVAARAYRATFGGRVLIVDFDYHHGNGTQDVAGDGLSYVSTHARPAYPGTGDGNVDVPDGVVVNVPLPASGVSTERFVATWERLLPEIARVAKPDAIVVSAGFDYVKGDPVGDLGVGVEAAGHLAAAINATALECDAALAYVLEGGYDVDALTDSIRQIVIASDANVSRGSGARLD